jgi:hypothetical protein
MVTNRGSTNSSISGLVNCPASALLFHGAMATTRRRSSSRKRSSSRRGSQKRDTVKARKATSYAKRTSTGRFREMDEKGRALASDRRRKAKTKTKAGYGDRGDRAA